MARTRVCMFVNSFTIKLAFIFFFLPKSNIVQILLIGTFFLFSLKRDPCAKETSYTASKYITSWQFPCWILLHEWIRYECWINNFIMNLKCFNLLLDQAWLAISKNENDQNICNICYSNTKSWLSFFVINSGNFAVEFLAKTKSTVAFGMLSLFVNFFKKII